MNSRTQNKLSLYEMALFAMFGAIMFISKAIMQFLPNVHLIGMFVILVTVLYRFKGLIPIYIFVFLDGFFYGFNAWWAPYLYVWTILWGITMLLPKNMPKSIAAFVYPVICSLHGFLFGVLYAPAQALLFGLNFTQTLAWIAAGLYFDLIHGVSNLFAGLLVLPLKEAIIQIEKSLHKR